MGKPDAQPSESFYTPHARQVTSILQWKSSSSNSEALLLRFLCLARFLHDKRLYAGKLLLEAVRKIMWSVLEKDDEAKSQNDEEDEPKKPAE